MCRSRRPSARSTSIGLEESDVVSLASSVALRSASSASCFPMVPKVFPAGPATTPIARLLASLRGRLLEAIRRPRGSPTSTSARGNRRGHPTNHPRLRGYCSGSASGASPPTSPAAVCGNSPGRRATARLPSGNDGSGQPDGRSRGALRRLAVANPAPSAKRLRRASPGPVPAAARPQLVFCQRLDERGAARRSVSKPSPRNRRACTRRRRARAASDCARRGLK
jgi:hypothetical protein